MITITEAAKAHFIAQMRKANKACMTLSMNSTGCNGYGFDYAFVPAQHGSILFDWTTDDEFEFAFYIDKRAVPFFENATIDLVKDGLNSRISYDLPLMTGSCGCGKSFSF